MIQLLSPRAFVRLVASVFLIAALIIFPFAFPSGNPTWHGLPRFLSFSTTLAFLMLAIAGHHRVIDWLWRFFPLLNHLAPNLNGRYRLSTSSNWALKKAMSEGDSAAKADLIEKGGLDRVVPYEGVLRIQHGLFTLRICYEPADSSASRSESTVLCSALRQNADSGDFELFYVFRARVPQPLSTDEQAYFGAAELIVKCDKNRVRQLRGSYWTNRSWRKGLNTAGIALAERR